MPHPSPTPPSSSAGWLEPVLWTLGMVAAITVFACVNETAGEVAVQGLAYLFAFVTTPFFLEASAAIVGLCIVLIINQRRIAKEGDGWVEMEVRDVGKTTDDEAKKQVDNV
ncbi:MAG: hypothetical protein R3F13_12115 [Prosthecobacter sp.]